MALTTKKKKKVELPDQIISLFKKVLRDDVYKVYQAFENEGEISGVYN